MTCPVEIEPLQCDRSKTQPHQMTQQDITVDSSEGSREVQKNKQDHISCPSSGHSSRWYWTSSCACSKQACIKIISITQKSLKRHCYHLFNCLISKCIYYSNLSWLWWTRILHPYGTMYFHQHSSYMLRKHQLEIIQANLANLGP